MESANPPAPSDDVPMSSVEEELAKKDLIAQKLKQEGKDSAHNSDADENEDMKDARERKQDQENEKLVNYHFLGSEDCPVDPTATEIEYSMIWRIPRIENLGQCKDLTVSNTYLFTNVIFRDSV